MDYSLRHSSEAKPNFTRVCYQLAACPSMESHCGCTDENVLRSLLRSGTAAASEGARAGKASRKERLHARKAAKRAERAAGSDDEDIGAAGPSVEVVHLPRAFSLRLP